MRAPPSDTEQLLRRSRPEPRREFLLDLEASLVGSRQARLVPSWRPGLRVAPRLFAAVAGAGAVAAALLVLSLAGVRPLGTGGTTGAEAGRTCVTRTEWRLEREPRLQIDRVGRLVLTNRPRLVPQQRRRCR